MSTTLISPDALSNPFSGTNYLEMYEFTIKEYLEFSANRFGQDRRHTLETIIKYIPALRATPTSLADADDLNSLSLDRLSERDLFEKIFSEVSDGEKGRLPTEFSVLVNNLINARRMCEEISAYNRNVILRQQTLEKPHLLESKIPGTYAANGFAEMYSRLKSQGYSVEEADELVSSVTVRGIITAHPTNVFSIERYKLIKDCKENLLKAQNKGDARHFIGNFFNNIHNTDVVARQKLTVTDETHNGLYHLENHWDAIPRIRAQAEEAKLSIYANNINSKEHRRKARWDTKISVPDATWVSADKDGNPAVTFDETLNAIKLHNESARKAASIAIQKIRDALAGETLTSARQETLNTLQKLLHEGVDYNREDGTWHSRTVGKDGFQVLKMNHFSILEKLEELYFSIETDAADDEILAFKSQLENMGNSMGYMEYRENKKIHIKAANALASIFIEGYTADSQAEETTNELLTTALLDLMSDDIETRQSANDRLADAFAELLDSNDPEIVTNAKRAMIAVVNPSIASDNIIAEATKTSQPLGVLFFQFGAAAYMNKERDDQGNSPYKQAITKTKPQDAQNPLIAFFQPASPFSQRITPLNEKVDALAEAPEMMMQLLMNPAYSKALEAQPFYFRYLPAITLQHGMIAMSDSTRQDGFLAAHLAQRKAVRELTEIIVEYCEQVGIPFGSGSTSVLRGGALSLPQRAEIYGKIHEALKSFAVTIQGFDPFHFFNGATTGPTIAEAVVQMVYNQLYFKDESPEGQLARDLSLDIDKFWEDNLIKFASDTYHEDFFEDSLANIALERLGYIHMNKYGDVASRPLAKGGTGDVAIANSRTIGVDKTVQKSQAVLLAFAGHFKSFNHSDGSVRSALQNPDINTALGQALQEIGNDVNLTEDAKLAHAYGYMYENGIGNQSLIESLGINSIMTNADEMWRKLNQTNEPAPSLENLKEIAAMQLGTAMNAEQKMQIFAARLLLDVSETYKHVYMSMTGCVMPEEYAQKLGKMHTLLLKECFPQYKPYVARMRQILPALDLCNDYIQDLVEQGTMTEEEATLHLRGIQGCGDNIVLRPPYEAAHVEDWTNFKINNPEAGALLGHKKRRQTISLAINKEILVAWADAAAILQARENMERAA
jgi:hypothetical protein